LNVPEPNLVQTVTREDPRLPDLLWGIFVTGIKPDRRQVMRAGAWTVPAIAVAAAAPAFATSGANINNPGSTGPITESGNGANREFRLTATIRNDGTVATENLTVRISIAGGSSPTVSLLPASGFNPPTIEVSGTTTTFVFTATSQLAPNGGIIGPLVFGVKPGNSNGTISVTYTATNSPSKTFTTVTV
jgi:hypothetical protein